MLGDVELLIELLGLLDALGLVLALGDKDEEIEEEGLTDALGL